MKNTNPWRPIETAPANRPIETKIDDEKGCRNVAVLVLKGRLWWFPDGSMYVYYMPTHWREV